MKKITILTFLLLNIIHSLIAQDNRQKVVDAVSVPYSASKSAFMNNRVYSIGSLTVGTNIRSTIIQQDIQLKPVGFFFEYFTRPSGPSNRIEFIYGLTKTSDNHLMLIGTYGVPGDAAIWVIKLDTLENIVWEKEYKVSDYQAPSTSIENDLGGFLMAGHLISPGVDPIHLLNIDVNGDTVWTRKIVSNSGSDLRVNMLFRENNGDYVIGHRVGYQTELVRFNPSGTLQSNYTYNDGAGTTLTITGAKNYGNYTYYFGSMAGGDWTSFIMKTDNNGNVIWCKNYSEIQDIKTMNIMDDGNILAQGTIGWGPNIYKSIMMKIDTSGTPLITKAYGQLPYSHILNNSLNLSNGKYLFTGSRGYQTSTVSYQIVVDNDLNSGSCYEKIITTPVISVPMNKVVLNNVSIQQLAADFTYIGPPSGPSVNPGVSKVDYDIDNVLIPTLTTIGDDCGGSCNGQATISTIGGNPGYIYLWSNGQSGNTATGLCGGSMVSVRTTDQLGCTNYDTLSIPSSAPVTPICVVTVDSTSTKNVVVWEKPVSNSITGFTIYRDVVGNYSLVGYVPYDSLSVFIDNTNGVNPNITAYRYKIKTLDSCGNESLLSDYHKTIHLTVNQGFNNNVNLIWDNYQGLSFSYNRILRDSTGMGNWQVLDSVANNVFTWTDFNPTTNPSNYMIEVVIPSVCVATRAENHNTTRSNRGTLLNPGIDGIDEFNISFSIYPNPATGRINISKEGMNEPVSISVVDATGRILKTLVIYPGVNTFDLSELANGIYFIREPGKNSMQKVLIQK